MLNILNEIKSIDSDLKKLLAFTLLILGMVVSISFLYKEPYKDADALKRNSTSTSVLNCSNARLQKFYYDFEDSAQLNDFTFLDPTSLRYMENGDFDNNGEKEIRLNVDTGGKYAVLRHLSVIETDFKALLNINNIKTDINANTFKSGFEINSLNYKLYQRYTPATGSISELVLTTNVYEQRITLAAPPTHIVLGIDSTVEANSMKEYKLYYKIFESASAAKDFVTNAGLESNIHLPLADLGMTYFYTKQLFTPSTTLSLGLRPDTSTQYGKTIMDDFLLQDCGRQPECSVDNDCSAGNYCNQEQLCIAGCRYDYQCSSSQMCQNFACVTNPNPENKVRIMTINYNPIDPATGKAVADIYFPTPTDPIATRLDPPRRTLKRVENNLYTYTQAHFQQQKTILSNMTGGTFQFEIVKDISINSFPINTDGFQFTTESYAMCARTSPKYNEVECEKIKNKFSYENWATQNNICQLITENNIDMVLMYSLPYVMLYEDFMFGPTDSPRTNGASYIIPGCNKHVFFVDGTYDTPNKLTHSFSHHVETMMIQFAEQLNEADAQKYVHQFIKFEAQPPQLSRRNSQLPIRCGNTHYPFNTAVEYEYSNLTYASHNCQSLSNFPNVEPIILSKPINASAWQGDNTKIAGMFKDQYWQQYWMSFIPHNAGSTTMTSKNGKEFSMNNNWWYYVFKPDNVVRLKSDALN